MLLCSSHDLIDFIFTAVYSALVTIVVVIINLPGMYRAEMLQEQKKYAQPYHVAYNSVDTASTSLI